MNVTDALLHILVVLVAAKLAAEAAERVHVPAVVGEIVAGIIVGPSVLGLVHTDDVLRILGELGVILLLFEVGMEMDLAELGAVGRASILVACAGVVAPFAGGFALGRLTGMSGNEALFVGAALTATSVGITARVFGDLRALASVEARTVLGAAVADDVIGLVILTVVVRIVGEGSVSLSSVGAIVGVAVGFLAVATVLGVRLAPSVFQWVARHSRSSGTLVALALAFTLAVAELASAARLAPIVGAFVAGLALSRSHTADRIRREITPVGHLFIPVFFLQIGIDADISAFARPSVLRLAGLLFVVAVLGKQLAAVGMIGQPGDRLLVGLGMIPRGEVGLIFATIGLRQHVFGDDVYAALLLVVLATTMLTPAVLRWRLVRLRSRPSVSTAPQAPRPAGGWLRTDEHRVDLAASPPLGEALEVALHAAVLAGRRQPGPALLDWLTGLPEGALAWNPSSARRLVELLRDGTPRSWRLLDVTGLLDRAFPELADAMRRRRDDPSVLDPLGALRWDLVDRVEEARSGSDRVAAEMRRLAHPEWVLLAALVLDAVGDAEQSTGEAVVVARRVVQRLGLGAAAEQAVAGLVQDRRLLSAAAARFTSVNEEGVLPLADHLASPEQARALYVLTVADDRPEGPLRQRLDLLADRLDEALAHPELSGLAARNLVGRRRAASERLTDDADVRDRISAAPRAYVLAHEPEDLVRHARLCEPPPGRRTAKVAIGEATEPRTWRVEVACRDRAGLLAGVAAVLGEARLDILSASVATWADGCALESFVVRDGNPPDADALRVGIEAGLDRIPPLVALPAARVSFDNDASPWHTICTIDAADQPRLLQAITATFAVAAATVHTARIATSRGRAHDEFALTDASGNKLDLPMQDRIVTIMATGRRPTRRSGSRKQNGTLSQQPSHGVETKPS